MSTTLPAEIRERRMSISEELRRLDGEKRSIELTIAGYPEASYMRHQLPGIDARRRELQTELEALQAESSPKKVPPEPALSVGETESHLEKLLARIDSADRELIDVRSKLPGLRAAYEAAVIGDADMSAPFSELEAARHLEAELVSSLKILRDAIPGVEADLERVKVARAERERLHWAAVASEVPAGIERWCCLIRAHGRPGVRRPVLRRPVPLHPLRAARLVAAGR